MPRFRLQINDQEREFEAVRQGNSWQLVNDDLTIDLVATDLAEGRYLLEYQDSNGATQRIQLAGHRAADNRQLWVDGRTLVVKRIRKQATAGAVYATTLASSIPAVVSQVLVSEGDEVAAGDKLILLESMKMVIPIQAPADGRIIKINCSAGDSVPAGLQLLEFEPL